MAVTSKIEKHHILNRFQFLERVYILSAKDDEKPDLSKGFSCTDIGTTLGLDTKQSLDIADILTKKDLVQKMTVGNDDIKLRLTPKGSHIIEMIHDKKEPQQQSTPDAVSVEVPIPSPETPPVASTRQPLHTTHEKRLIIGLTLSFLTVVILLILAF